MQTQPSGPASANGQLDGVPLSAGASIESRTSTNVYVHLRRKNSTAAPQFHLVRTRLLCQMSEIQIRRKSPHTRPGPPNVWARYGAREGRQGDEQPGQRLARASRHSRSNEKCHRIGKWSRRVGTESRGPTTLHRCTCLMLTRHRPTAYVPATRQAVRCPSNATGSLHQSCSGATTRQSLAVSWRPPCMAQREWETAAAPRSDCKDR